MQDVGRNQLKMAKGGWRARVMSRVEDALDKGSPEESRKRLFEDLKDGWKAKALADPAEAADKKAAAKAKAKARGRPAKEKKTQPSKKERQRSEILDMWGQITKPKVFNLPGF